MINEHLGIEPLYKNRFDYNVKIVSVKASIIFTLVFFEVMMWIAAAMVIKGIYEIAQIVGWNTALFFSKDFLMMFVFLLICIYCIYGVFEGMKGNIYVVKLEEEEFTYKFIFKRIIPYKEIEKLQLKSINYRGRDSRALHIRLKNGKSISLRLDHLYFYKRAEVIRPRDTRYLHASGEEDLILEFFNRKTGKPIEEY